MFYLMTHSTHYIYRYMTYGKEALSERGNLLLPHGLFFLVSSKLFYMHHPRQDKIYQSLCYTSPGPLA